MDDLESIEDMLAALEGPSGGTFGSDLDSISNIDDFLDQIEEEARMTTQGGKHQQPQSRPVSVMNNPKGAQPPQAQQARPTSNAFAQPQNPQRAAPGNARNPSTAQLPQRTTPSTFQVNRQPAPSVAQAQQQPARNPSPSTAQPARATATPSYGQLPQQAQPARAQSPSYAQPQQAQRASPSYAQPQQAQAYTAQPARAQSPSYAQPPQAQPARAQSPSYAQPPQAQQPAKQQPQKAQQAPPPQQSEPSNENDFASMGYEVLKNRGKWVSYNGKATDFRIKGTTSTRVGLAHVITLRALDDNGTPAPIDKPKDFIGVILTHMQTGDDVTCWYRDNGNCEYDLGFVSEAAGVVKMEIKLASNPMFEVSIHVEDIGTSLWVAKPRLPAKPKEVFIIDIETVDGSRPEGVAPFEVQTVGSVENLRLINNGDGTYRFQCIPQAAGHITIQLTLHGQPIKNSPVTVQVGERPQMKIKQESTHVETLSDTRPPNQQYNDDFDVDSVDFGTGAAGPDYGGGGYGANYGGGANFDNAGYGGANYDQGNYGGAPYGAAAGGNYGGGGNYHSPSQYGAKPAQGQSDVSNEDLNRLLDELGG